MKLRQREYCHNCQQYVTYEFEDITDRQVIICPNCGHQHYRELDEGTILNIRTERMNGDLRTAMPPNMTDLAFNDNPDVMAEAIPLETKTFKIIGHTADGRPIIEKTKEDLNFKGEDTKTISERRWGRDPRQI